VADYDDLRSRHSARYGELFGVLTERLSWSRDQIEQHQTEELRVLVTLARARSPWHRDRLADVDVEALTRDDLDQLPVMTKRDLMANWDEIVTDPRLNLALAERHVQSIETDAYLLDEFHVVASGGSSGVRGVFAWGWDAWAAAMASTVRWAFGFAMKHPETMTRPPVVAMIAADAPTHMSSALPQTFRTPGVTVHRLPVTMPMKEIVASLNDLQPTRLGGYASALYELALEARAGRLQISPFTVVPDGEPLLAEMRGVLEQAWGAPVGSLYGTSEGCTTGSSCLMGPGMHLTDDLLLIEPVDSDGRPVAPGKLSTKILLTNLYNPTLPLIRYEITDQLRVVDEPCPCGCEFTRIDDVQGRLDHTFTYEGNVVIHPHVFRSPLSRHPQVIEYQVRQTERGAEIDVRLDGSVDILALSREIAHHLTGAGVARPEVSVSAVAAIERTPAGKHRRFVQLP
jgi:phenylacetate-CoA ligase